VSVAAASTPRPRRAPGFVHLAAALIVLLIVLLIALRANPSTPPLVAEFAPQVEQVIKQAPNGQGGSQGGQGAGLGGGAATPTPTPLPTAAAATATPPPVVQSIHCYGGDPPRQIEDPQSPPCVTLDVPSAKNGGKTSPQGVDNNTITIYWPCQCSGPSNTGFASAPAFFQKFFNNHFDFYGRNVNLIMEPNGTATDTAGMQALAADVASKGAFASAEYVDTGGWDYHETLASKGVVSVFGFEANPTEAQLAQSDPYLWSYDMGADSMFTAIGNWYCSELNARTAQWSPTFSTVQRKLGIVYAPWEWDQNTPRDPLEASLARCGVTNPYIVADSSENQTNAVLGLKGANVTSVLCLCDLGYWAVLTDDAAGQGYFPEWLMSSFGGDDSNWAFHFAQPNPSEASHAFGLSFNPRQWPLADDPMWWAWTEGCQCTPSPVAWNDLYQAHLLYRSFLELMAGIQMAGPDLNPSTFGRGLQNTAFPNPSPPDPVAGLHAGSVDFFNGSHAMTVDANEWWYSPTAQGPYVAYGDGPGSICYIAGGTRHSITQWPRAPSPFFQGTCDSGG
jgi:hypothetical protein